MPVLKINNANIDWQSADSHLFFNPRTKNNFNLKKLPFLKGHIYLFSSSETKIYLLSKSSFLASAKAVNRHLEAQAKDRWLVSLPVFHVAGLAILARSFLKGRAFKPSQSLWQVQAFKKNLLEKKISLCSLVPAQIYDLLQAKLKAPKSLRAIIVGGGSLSPDMYKKAKQLGWPLLISYGLTEACSQVACSTLSSLDEKSLPKMRLLSHIEIKQKKIETYIKNSDNKTHVKKITQKKFETQIKSPSLLTAYFENNKLKDPKDNKGWLTLPDDIAFKNKELRFKGRKDEIIKILGEKVNLKQLCCVLNKLTKELSKEYCLIALPKKREGFCIALISDSFNFAESLRLIKHFNQKTAPYENIKSLYFVPKINKTALFKTKQSLLKQQLAL